MDQVKVRRALVGLLTYPGLPGIRPRLAAICLETAYVGSAHTTPYAYAQNESFILRHALKTSARPC